MNYLQLHFRNRATWLMMPLEEAEFRRVQSTFSDRHEDLHFFEYSTQHGLCAWANGANVQMARFLFEPFDLPRFAVADIKPSVQEQFDGDSEANLDEVHWEVSVWIAGRTEPVRISDVSGHDWLEITTSLGDRPFFFITDGDGEELAVRTSDIDLLVGLEFERYSDQQFSAAIDEVVEEEKRANQAPEPTALLGRGSS